MWGHAVATWQKVRVSHFRFGRAKADLLRYEVQSRSGKKWFRAASMSGSATSLLTKLHGSCRSFSLWPLCCCLLCGFVMFTQKPMSSLFLWRPLPQPRILQRSLEWVMWWLPVGRYRLYDTLTGLQQHLWCFLSSVWLEEQRHSVQKRLPREVDFASIFFLWRLPDLIREHPFGTSKNGKMKQIPSKSPLTPNIDSNKTKTDDVDSTNKWRIKHDFPAGMTGHRKSTTIFIIGCDLIMLGGGIVSATVVPKAKVKLKYVAKLKLNLGLGIYFGRRSKEDGGNKRDFFKMS